MIYYFKPFRTLLWGGILKIWKSNKFLHKSLKLRFPHHEIKYQAICKCMSSDKRYRNFRPETHHWQYIFRWTQFIVSWLLVLCSIFIFSRNFFIYLASDTATAESRSTRNVKEFTPTLFYQFPSDSVPKTFINRQQYLQFCMQG